MKKLFIFCALILSAHSAYSQTQINPIVGINTFVLSANPDSASANVSIGWTIGLNFRLGDQMIFLPGIHYLHEQNGVTIPAVSGNNAHAEFVVKDDIDLLRFPLLVGFRFFKIKEHDVPFNINLHGGTSVIYLLSATDHTTKKDKSSNYNSLGFALTGGIGLDILFLTLDVDIDYGITKVYSDSYNDPDTELRNIRNGFTGKPFGFRINLGGKYQF